MRCGSIIKKYLELFLWCDTYLSSFSWENSIVNRDSSSISSVPVVSSFIPQFSQKMWVTRHVAFQHQEEKLESECVWLIPLGDSWGMKESPLPWWPICISLDDGNLSRVSNKKKRKNSLEILSKIGELKIDFLTLMKYWWPIGTSKQMLFSTKQTQLYSFKNSTAKLQTFFLQNLCTFVRLSNFIFAMYIELESLKLQKDLNNNSPHLGYRLHSK